MCVWVKENLILSLACVNANRSEEEWGSLVNMKKDTVVDRFILKTLSPVIVSGIWDDIITEYCTKCFILDFRIYLSNIFIYHNLTTRGYITKKANLHWMLSNTLAKKHKQLCRDLLPREALCGLPASCAWNERLILRLIQEIRTLTCT